MTYLAIVKVSPDGRVEKYQEYADAESAAVHVAGVKDVFPDAYSVLHPGGKATDLLCNPAAKTVTISPLPVIPPPHVVDARLAGDPVLNAIIDILATPGPVPSNRAAMIAQIKARIP